MPTIVKVCGLVVGREGGGGEMRFYMNIAYYIHNIM